MGVRPSPEATTLVLIAAGGGSQGVRIRLWQPAVPRLADETGLRLAVGPWLPGTRQWHKMAHRLFASLPQTWRGRQEVVVTLIGRTTTQTGLHMRAARDPNRYEPGKKITDNVWAKGHSARERFHGQWNDTIVLRDARH
jgi:hypothetical protein